MFGAASGKKFKAVSVVVPATPNTGNGAMNCVG